jgi:hypothetical protein
MSNEKVRKDIREKADKAGSYPLQVKGSTSPGSSAQPVWVGRHEVLFWGDTGLIATQFGLHGLGVTVGRLSTGVYGIRFPEAAHVSIMAGVCVPSGGSYDVAVCGMSGTGRVVGMSGSAQINISQLGFGATGGNFEASLTRVPQNPVTGTVAVFDVYSSATFQNDKNTLVPY